MGLLPLAAYVAPASPGHSRCDHVDPVPTPLNTYMTDKAPLWGEIVRKYDLQPVPYEQLVYWSFGDFILNSGFDNISSTIKARRAGFSDCIDTEDMFLRPLQRPSQR